MIYTISSSSDEGLIRIVSHLAKSRQELIEEIHKLPSFSVAHFADGSVSPEDLKLNGVKSERANGSICCGSESFTEANFGFVHLDNGKFPSVSLG